MLSHLHKSGRIAVMSFSCMHNSLISRSCQAFFQAGCNRLMLVASCSF
jgi:hypothetical protein